MNTIRSRFVAVVTLLVVIAFASGIAVTLVGAREVSIAHTGIHVAIALALLLVLTGLSGYLLAQTIVRRLYEIEEAAVLIADGRLQHRIVGFGGQDEIDHLAAQFNRMGERIEQQVALLQQLAEENVQLARQAEQAATMEERQRVARELHDSVSQQLFSLSLLAASARARGDSADRQTAELVSQIEHLANQAQREMRALLLHLRPIDLEGRDFAEAAKSFLGAVADRHALAWTFRSTGVQHVPPAVEEQLFRILQEAVSNVLKHAHASSVAVHLSEQSTRYELTITDDGQGLGVGVVQRADAYGLPAMKERASRLGGQMELLERRPGLTVKVVIPKAGVQLEGES